MPDEIVEESEGQFRPTSGEKVIILMLCELFRHLGVEKHALNLELIEEAAVGKHHWALEWEFSPVFERGIGGDIAAEVGQILDMWSTIEHSYRSLSPEDRANLEKDAGITEYSSKFRGFDLNTEVTHYSVARVMIQVLGRFSDLEGRELNSHYPVLDRHRAMMTAYMPMNKTRELATPLTREQVQKLLALSP